MPRRSSAERSRSAQCSMATTLRCSIATALGRPVEPEVVPGRTRAASGRDSRDRGWRLRHGLRRARRRGPCTRGRRAAAGPGAASKSSTPTSSIVSAWRACGYAGSIGTYAAPALSTASKLTISSGVRAECTRRRAPARTPWARAASAPAGWPAGSARRTTARAPRSTRPARPACAPPAPPRAGAGGRPDRCASSVWFHAPTTCARSCAVRSGSSATDRSGAAAMPVSSVSKLRTSRPMVAGSNRSRL